MKYTLVDRIPKEKKEKVPVKSQHSDKKKLEAVQLYLMLGSILKVSQQLNIPEQTLWYWKRSEWWHKLETTIREEEAIVLSSKMKRLVDKSLEHITDRLDKGDWIYDQKTGQLKRKPVTLRDVHNVAKDLIDRTQKLEQQGNFTVTQENIAEKLEKLAQSFEEFATKKKPVVEVTDVIFAEETSGEQNAIHEERQEGL